MATVKITQLPSITGANSAATDVVPMVDVSADVTSKITRQEFFDNIPAASVVGDLTIGDKIVHSGDTDTAIRFPTTDTVTVETSGSERLRVTSTGSVGIGTSSPGSLLTLYSATNATLAVQGDATANVSTTRSSNDGQSGILNSRKARGTTAAPLVVNAGDLTGQIFHQAYDGSGYVTTSQILAAASTVTGTGNIGGFITFTTRTDGAASTLTERVRITAAGNVGIGTSSPSTTLQVVGTVTATGFSGPLTGNASTATTLQTSRTLWGQSFNGSANVTGDLTSVGNITGTAGINLLTTTTGALSLDTGTTGAINIGTNANAKTVTIGNGTGATSLVLQAGTGAINIGTNAVARTITIGNGTGASSVVLEAGTGAINIGTNAVARTITVGNATGASAVAIDSGSGNIILNGANSNRVGINTTAPVTALHVAGASMTTGVVYVNQPAQTTITGAATLTIAQLLTGIIQYTAAGGNTLTLPTGTLIEGGLPATFPTDMAFDFSVISTGGGTATLGTATGLTLVGSMAVASGASGRFRVRKTATNTYTVYRI